MASVASRDLRNHTADVLRRVAAGQRITVTVHGAPVAELIPVAHGRRRTMSRRELMSFVEAGRQADPGLTNVLEELAGDTTDDLDPLS